MRNIPLSATIALTLASAAFGQAPAKVTFNDHILPIFRNACLNCHNPDKKKAGLDLSTYTATLQGSENGKVLESGNAAASLLFKSVKQVDADLKMPPKGDKLSDAELAIMEKWIAGQLLETATGKAVAAAANNVKTAVVSLTKPDGPPPMPGELPLEPAIRTTRHNALTALAASPWAPLVAVGGQKQIILYNTETLEPLGILPFPEGFPAIIKFSRNGQLLLTGGGLGGKSGKVVLWDIATGDRIAVVGNEFDQVLAADLSADQQFVALGGPGKLVKIYATKDGRLVTSIKKHTDWVTAIAYSPDGRYLASADRNGGIQVWEGSTGKEFNALPGHKVMVTSLAFMTGVVASASEDGTIVLWDIKEAKEIKKITAHPGGVAWVDFTPDGRLVSCGRDKIAKVWDQTGKELGKTAEPFADIALRAALSNERIIAGDWSGEIRVCSLDGKRIGDLSSNPPALADRLAAAQKKLTDAQAALAGVKQQLAAAEQKAAAEKAAPPVAAPTPQAELAKKLEQQTAEVAALREARAKTAAGSPDFTAADAKVQAKKVELAQTQAALSGAPAAPAAPVASPAAEELAKARATLDQTTAQIASATVETERWSRAQAFMKVHTAKQTLSEKQSQLEESIATAKDALAPAEQAQAALVAAEKAAADAPAQIKEKEALLAQAQQAAEPLSKGVGAAEAALAEKETAAKSATESFDKATAAAVELTKKAEAQTAEAAKLREARAAKAAGSPEYAAADAAVQAKKADLAQTQAALAPAQAQVAALKPQAEPIRAEVAKLREALEKARADAKAATEKTAAAEKALAATRKASAEAAGAVAKLRKEAPEIAKTARAAKAQAEKAAAVAAKDLEAAKSSAARARAEFETRWKPGEKSAAAAALPAPKS